MTKMTPPVLGTLESALYAGDLDAALGAHSHRAVTPGVFLVGIIYIAVVTLASIFLSHRTVGPLGRVESDLRRLADSEHRPEPLKVREGDELEGIVTAINRLISRISK